MNQFYMYLYVYFDYRRIFIISVNWFIYGGFKLLFGEVEGQFWL